MFEEEFIDRIYEAAIMPELWPELLQEMSRRVEGDGGILFTANLERMKWTTSPDIQDVFEEFIRDGWAAINQRPSRAAATGHLGFVRDNELLSPEEMDNDPLYRDFLRKRGLGWATGTLLDTPSGDTLIFSFERAHDKGPVPMEIVQAFDKLRPHLARSALLSARLGLERIDAMANALQTVNLPGAVLSKDGLLLKANALFEKVMPVLGQDHRQRLKLKDAAADRLFAEALANSAYSLACVSSIPLAASEERLPMILHLLPIRGSARDVFSRASFLLVVTPVDRSAVPAAKVLQGLFDLTPAESRVAQAVAEARQMDEIARASGVGLETVRSQLKSVLAKTGLSRQQELVNLLAGKQLPAPQEQPARPGLAGPGVRPTE